MKKLLLLLILSFFYTNSNSQKRTDGVKNDTIQVKYKEPHYYYNQSGKLLRESALTQGLSLGCFSLCGIQSYWMSKQNKKVWIYPILTGVAGLYFQIYSIHLKSKSGNMLILGAESDGLKAKLKF